MSLEVVLGPMFSGKSSYALSYVRRQRAIGKKVLVIKPDIDNRYTSENYLVTHDKEKILCMMWNVETPLCEINELNYDCFVVEEAQFFKHLHHFCSHLLFNLKKNILVVGLDGCAQQKKFGEILDIIPMATTVTKLTALCSVCMDGTVAPYTKKVWGGGSSENSQVDVGGADKYVAVCLHHL
jgi:thymidine kinase